MCPVAYLLAGALEAVRFFSNYFYLADNLTDYLTGNGPGRNPVHSVIGDWRFGVNSKKGKDNDLRYYNTFMKSYNN